VRPLQKRWVHTPANNSIQPPALHISGILDEINIAPAMAIGIAALPGIPAGKAPWNLLSDIGVPQRPAGDS